MVAFLVLLLYVLVIGEFMAAGHFILAFILIVLLMGGVKVRPR